MKKLIGFVVGLVVPAFIMARGVATSAMAQEKAAKGMVTTKVLLENAKVRVQEVTWKPGDVNTTVATSAYCIIARNEGGTTQWTHADGKKETKVRKTGEVYMLEPSPAYTVTNVGKTEFQLYVVVLK